MEFAGARLLNFRSIGAEGVDLRPWSKCNVLVGQNNSGKSNVMRALALALRAAKSGRAGYAATELETASAHKLNAAFPFKFRLYFRTPTGNAASKWSRIGTEGIHFDFELAKQGGLTITGSSLSDLVNGNRLPGENEPQYLQRWQGVYSDLTDSRLAGTFNRKTLSKEFERQNARIFDSHVSGAVPDVQYVPEFRRIQEGTEYSLAGHDLIRQLARFQHPPEGEERLKENFVKIEAFLRQLLHMPEATLEVSHDSKSILLDNDGLRLSLFSYGTGVHELTILLTAVLSRPGSVFCIEEPEIHLHPRLQRELLLFLAHETEGTFVLSTHSPALLNAHVGADSVRQSPIQVFHITRQNGGSVSRTVFADDEVLVALDDLGIRASDLVQANCVIWVEGPSDRIYLNAWLHQRAPQLVEGLHYSVMFYGGRLLAHLSLSRDGAAEDLIQLLRLNQHSVVIMDSDKRVRDGRRKEGKVSRTKLRVHAELERVGGFGWITDGREIENYLTDRLVNDFCLQYCNAVTSVRMRQFTKFDDTLRLALKHGASADGQPIRQQVTYSDNKVAYARHIANLMVPEDIKGSLSSRLDSLVTLVNQWNR